LKPVAARGSSRGPARSNRASPGAGSLANLFQNSFGVLRRPAFRDMLVVILADGERRGTGLFRLAREGGYTYETGCGSSAPHDGDDEGSGGAHALCRAVVGVLLRRSPHLRHHFTVDRSDDPNLTTTPTADDCTSTTTTARCAERQRSPTPSSLPTPSTSTSPITPPLRGPR
jgi:hypothetical protein